MTGRSLYLGVFINKMLNFGSIRRWIIILVGIALATSMVVQQMALARHGDYFSLLHDDPNVDWKLAGFEQERHHHNEAEDTNYTWISNNDAQRITLKHNGDVADVVESSSSSEEILITESNPWMKILRNDGVEVSPEQEKLLPELEKDWKELFGMEPKILGMETCETYRRNVPPNRRIVAVAGLFNTGTNALEFHLRKNIKAPSKWQVPWGKHRDPSVRLQHIAPGMENVEQRDVLPIVIMRDPFHWMQSMCRSPYAAKWKRTKEHCPNLVPTKEDLRRFTSEMKESNNTFPVTVVFSKDQIMSWPSLVHLYSAWYRQYLQADYPHLIVRFEDMLWHPETILEHIAHCAGTMVAEEIAHQTLSAKSHGSGTDFLKAIFKSGNHTLRERNLTIEDKKYAAIHLDHELMEIMNYKVLQV